MADSFIGSLLIKPGGICGLPPLTGEKILEGGILQVTIGGSAVITLYQVNTLPTLEFYFSCFIAEIYYHCYVMVILMFVY